MDGSDPGNYAAFGMPQLSLDFIDSSRRNSGEPFAMNSTHQSSTSSAPFGIRSWHNGNDDPWSAIGLVESGPGYSANRQLSGAPACNRSDPAFTNYRERNLPSDCGTVAGDSGYGTNNLQYSIASNSSVRDDDGTVDHQMLKSMSYLGTAPTTPSRPMQSRTKAASRSHYCSVCNTSVKTKAELNKHRQRHSKSFYCPYSHCQRSNEGFSTKNDLARHRKSVHKEHHGHGLVFVCREGACEGKDKIWPRADNFRHHLHRIHEKSVKADDDLSEYIFNPNPNHTLRDTLKGVGSSVADIDHQSRLSLTQESTEILTHGDASVYSFLSDGSNRYFPELSSQIGLSEHELPKAFNMSESAPTGTATSKEQLRYTHQDSMRGFDSFSAALEPSLGQSHHYVSAENLSGAASESNSSLHETPAPVADIPAPAVGSAVPKVRVHEEDLHLIGNAVKNTHTDSGLDVPSPLEGTMPGDDPLSTMNISSLATTTQNPTLILEFLKTIPKELLETALDSETQSMARKGPASEKAESKTRKQCPDCPKSFNRPCELKKHMRRHEKPYRCTFRGCNKDFGSKNDWKRHESSQHLNLETWHCEEPDCIKACGRRESFKNHLEKDHQMADARLIEEKLEKCRMGRHCDPRFWCGFCVSIITIREECDNTWMLRCDHIDNHLFGKAGLEKKSSSDWEYQEDHSNTVDNRRSANTTSTSMHNSLSVTGDRRRKANFDLNPHPRKRPAASEVKAAGGLYLWFCHKCAEMNSKSINPTCVECQHQYCSECRMEFESPEQNSYEIADLLARRTRGQYMDAP